MPATPAAPARAPWGWLVALYLAQGFPLGLITEVVPAWFQDRGVGKAELGLLSILEAAWIGKFLWAPWVDARGSRRRWVVGGLVALAALSFLLWRLEAAGAGPDLLVLVVAAMALASATQDIAIDAWAVEAFHGGTLGHVSGARVNAARVGYLLSASVLLLLVEPLGWGGTWAVAAGALAVAAAATTRAPTPPRVPRAARAPLAIAVLARRRGFVVLALFLLLYKVGDYALAPMARQFLKAADGAGWSNRELGVSRTVALVGSVAGCALGGWFSVRRGLFAALLVLGVAQAGSNLAYVAAAAWPTPTVVWGAAAVEPFCGGLAMAPYGALMLAGASRAAAGADVAAFTALMALGRLAGGAVSGYGVEAMGRPGWFCVTALLALPALLLLPALRRAGWLSERDPSDGSGPRGDATDDGGHGAQA